MMRKNLVLSSLETTLVTKKDGVANMRVFYTAIKDASQQFLWDQPMSVQFTNHLMVNKGDIITKIQKTVEK